MAIRLTSDNEYYVKYSQPALNPALEQPDYCEFPAWCLCTNTMSRLWRFLLPICGLALFLAISVRSARWHAQHPSNRYFWWGSQRLVSDPLGKRYPSPPCTAPSNDPGNPVCWNEPVSILVEPGWMESVFVLTAFPAFLLGTALIAGLGKLGVSQVWTFMLSMPLLIGAWFHFVGWLIDRWRGRRIRRAVLRGAAPSSQT